MPENTPNPEQAKEPKKSEGASEKPEVNPNGASTPEDLTVIKAQLEEEKKAKATAEAALAEKDALIAALQTQLTEAKQGSEATAVELGQAKKAHTQAVAKYLGAVKLANPTIPGDVIVGGTIEEIDGTVAKALSIATAVKANLEAQAKQAKVPAGAPPRGEINLEGLSPREKIAVGIQQKGGTS